MFGNKKGLIDTESKATMDIRITEIIDAFTIEYLKAKKLILDTDLFLVGSHDVYENICEIEKRICKIMDINENNVEFEFSVNNQSQKVMEKFVHPNVPGSNFAGKYFDIGNRVRILLEESLIEEPIKLVATIVHELSHYKLLYEKRFTENDEIMTDILPTYFGFGLFASHSAVNFRGFDGIGMYGWKASTLGYLSEYEHGYILAQWAKMMSYSKKDIDQYLKPNVSQAFCYYYLNGAS